MNIVSNMYIGIGKRKSSTAKVCLCEGFGQIIVNNVLLNNSSVSTNRIANILNCIILRIYKINKIIKFYNTNIQVKGGGIISQINAIHLALAKAISKIDINYRKILRKKTFLTSDSRIKERRKYGLKKARKASQFTKR